MDDTSPTYVYTDACDIGIGGYITQLRPDGKEYPVAYLSKSFPKANMAWSINYKEAYAIYYTLVKFQYLLGGRKFTIRTDHKNLTFINTDRNIKALHWKLAIQEFDFDVEWIAGEDNGAADGFSRLCALSDEDIEYACSLFEAESIACLREEKEKIPDDKYEIIQQFHNEVVGHIGFNKLVSKLMKAGHTWPNLRPHVRQFLRQCDVCQKAEEHKPKLAVPMFTTSTYDPMERLNIDTIGPLPADDNGNQYILVVIDTFTRWIELYALKTLEATEAARALLQHFWTLRHRRRSAIR